MIISGKLVMVYIVNDSRKIISCRSGDDDILCASIDMSLSLSLGGVETGALQDYINTDLTPRSVVCIRDRIDLDLFSIDRNGIFTSSDSISLRISALGAVILQKMSKHLRGGQVVDCNDLKTLSSEHLTESKTSNTAESIDCNFYCHNINSS